ncbi:MAG: ABC transporter permease [Saprospiraceae bacterium]
MLINHLKIAFRNLVTHKFFSLLNIVGLALGMSTCMTVILIIRDQMSYDHFHANPSQVFRIICQQDDGMKLATTPYPIGDALVRDFSVVESSVRLVRSIQGIDATTASNLTLPVSGFYTEPSFFKIFGFQLEAGNAATALNEPNTMVISKKTAERFFGNQNPIGEILTLRDKGIYRITGVVAPPPGKSHIEFDCLASASSMTAIEAGYKSEEAVEKVVENWENRFMAYVYVRMSPGKTGSDLAVALAAIEKDRANAGKGDQALRYFSQNLGDVTPKPEMLVNDLGTGAPWFFIWGLVAFVAILIVFPCLNYANMAVARALSRTREVGVRKAIGARVGDIKRLILTEAVLTSLIALVVAWGLHLPLNHFVETGFPSGISPIKLQADASTWGIFIAFGIVVGFLAGWLPAQRLAKVQPTSALRGNLGGQLQQASRFNWRKAMLVGQFSVSLIFMIVVATLWSQMRFMTLADYGFQKENLLTVELQGNTSTTVAAEISQNPHVVGVCATSIVLAGNNLQGIPLQLERGGESPGIHCASVDANYIPVMGLELIAGENFPENRASEKEQYLILNEKAVKSFELGTSAEAVGKTLWLGDDTPVTIRGVIRDFNYRNFEHGIEPFALRNAPFEHGILHVRLAPGDPSTALAALEGIWKKIDQVHSFKAEFMEESMRRAYSPVTLMGWLASFFALLALSLACIGLLGMVTYTVSTRVKEIGVRKVLGASVSEVTLLLSRRFMVLLGMAVVIAIPAAYFLCNLFLNLFVYRIEVGGLILGGSTLALLALGLLTVGIQVVRAALANPVKSLRSE